MFKKAIISTLLCIVLLISSVLSVNAVPTSNLKLGSKGPDVKELQQKLSAKGLLDANYVTGFFGPNTVAAVKEFQKSQGINQTGVVAELTINALYEQNKFDTSLVLRSGDENATVKRLQQVLCNMGYLKQENVTGYFGAITETAVKTFQAVNNISATGVVAKLTLEKINSLTNIVKLDTSRVYKSGDEDSGVKALQQRLCQLGYLAEKYVTGYYGAITVSAVKKFQKNHQISQTGTVAELTLKELNSVSAKADGSNGIDEIDIIAKPGSLRLGDRGPQVKALQQNLKKLGYFSGTATGEYGNVTKQAVIKFQKAYSLTADGIAGSKTLSKIQAAISGSSSSSSSSASSGSANVSGGFTSANMNVINSALATLTPSEIADIELMARVIKREVGGNTYRAQVAVGSVIMNRVKRTGATIYAVLHAPNQFSTVNSSLPYETYSTSHYYAAIEAYMGAKPVGECRYFCSVSVRYTCWAGKNRTYYCTIGSECFFL